MRHLNKVRTLRLPLVLGLALSVAGCDDRREPAEGTPAATGTTPAAPVASPDAVTPPTATPPAAMAVTTYTSQGLIANVRETQGGLLVQIHHEPIPEFKDRTGQVIGMKEMVMDFPAQAGAMQGVAVGDAVTFTFDVDWTKTPAHRLMTVRKLPPGTELRIGTLPAGEGTNPQNPGPANPGGTAPGNNPGNPGSGEPRGGTTTPPPPPPASNPK